MRALLKLSLFLCFVGFVMVAPLQAQSSYLNWLNTAGTNDWNTASNWDINAVPDAGSQVLIDVVGPANTPVISSGEVANAYQLGVGGFNAGGATGYLQIDAGGALTVQDEIFVGVGSGNYGLNEINIAGGTLTKATGTGNFHIGWQVGSGEVIMSGASLYYQAGANCYIGAGGNGASGTFTMSGSSIAKLPDSVTTVGCSLNVAGGCSGLLHMEGTSQFNTFELVTGWYAGGSGTIEVSGTSTMNIDWAGNYIGAAGVGVMTVGPKATVNVRRRVIGAGTTISAVAVGPAP